MADDDTHVTDLWQRQTAEGFRLTSEEIQMKLQTLESKLRARTRSAYLVSAFLIIGFSGIAFFERDLLMRLGCAATIVAVGFLTFQAHRSRFGAGDAPQMELPSLDSLRNELQRQRDFHRGKWFWSRFALLAPAGLLFYIAFARAHPELIRIIRFEIVSFVLILLAAIPLNLRLAKKYQRQIDELDRQKELA
jgi:hypothetical protein